MDEDKSYELADDQWYKIADLFPSSEGKRRGQWLDHRTIMNGMFRVLCSGANSINKLQLKSEQLLLSPVTLADLSDLHTIRNLIETNEGKPSFYEKIQYPVRFFIAASV